MPPLHLALILIACLAWGFNFIASAAGLQHWPPFLFTTLRFVIVAVVLAAIIRKPPREQWPRLIAVCLCNGGLHFTLFFIALRGSTDISSVAIAMQSYVPMAAIIAWLLLGEKFGWRSATAIAVAFSGVLLVGFDPQVLQQLDVLAITLLSALCLAFGTTLMRRLEGVDPFSFQGWTALISLPVLIVGSLVFESEQLAALTGSGWIPWASVTYSALAASIVGHGIFFYLVRRHRVADVTPYLLLAPVLAIVFGIILWGDRPGWKLYLGAALVFGGVFTISRRSAVRQQARITR